MRLYTLFLAILACWQTLCFPLNAQPDWVKKLPTVAGDGKISREATSYTLFDVMDLEIKKNGDAKLQARVARKIITDEGLASAVVTIPEHPFLKLKHLTGWLLKPNGDTEKLDKDNIVRVGFQESSGYYDDTQITTATFSNPQPGDIVAFEVKIEEEGWASLFQQFVFQERQPVKHTQLILTLNKGWEVFFESWNCESIDFQEEEDGDKTIYRWTGEDLPYQPEEPLSPPLQYLARQVRLAAYHPQKEQEKRFDNWNAVSAWTASIQDPAVNAEDNILRTVSQIAGDALTIEEKLEKVAEFCQQDIRYVAVEIGKGRWKPRLASQTLFNRYGDCKDKTALMRAMLTTLDIPSYAVLASVNHPVSAAVPTPFQFDHCIVGVDLAGIKAPEAWESAMANDRLFFDPTDPSTPIGELPVALQGKPILIAADDDSVFQRIPYPAPQEFERIYRVKAILAEDGSFMAQMRISDTGANAFRSQYFDRIVPQDEKMLGIKAVIEAQVPNARITEYLTESGPDSFHQQISIKGESYVQQVGELLLLRPAIVTCAEFPKLAARKRIHPVWFGGPQSVKIDLQWLLPQGWEAEVDPAPLKSSCEAGQVVSQTFFENGALGVNTELNINGKLVYPEAYDTARDFAGVIDEINKFAIILKPGPGGK